MERGPPLTIEGNPLCMKSALKEILYYRRKSLIDKETGQGNPFTIKVNSLLWKEIPSARSPNNQQRKHIFHINCIIL
jgi:hypothetical protein